MKNNTQDRQETKYNALVGRIDNQYYFLDYTFKHSDNFKGATGSVLTPLTEEEYREREEDYFDPENMRDFWVQAVQGNHTTDSLEDFIEQVRDETDSVLDDSYERIYGVDLRDLLGEDKVYRTDCTGGGRCFEKGMQFDEVYNQELVDIINQFED